MSNQPNIESRLSCAVVMATCGRHNLLRTLSLPSVRRQTCAPILAILVDDGCGVSPDNVRELSASLFGIELVLLKNRRSAGAAGAWNTGLDYLAAAKFDGFVAMLDDDDEWDENHLAENVHAALSANATVVISGLRLVRD